MRLLACFLAASCWTGPAVVPETPVAKPIKCTIHDTEVAGTAKLSAGGLVFANQSEVTRLDVTFQGGVGRARIENSTVVLEGDLDLVAMPIRPRDVVPQDGWLEIRHATAKLATGNVLRIEAALPEGLAPKTVQFALPCTELTFAAPPDPAETTNGLPRMELAIGTQLRPRPDGAAVVRANAPLDGVVIEQRGGMSRVRIDGGENVVFGWVSTPALKPSTLEEKGGFGFGRTGYGRHQYTCSRDVGIFVRVGGRAMRVGRIKKDAGFYLNDADDEDDDMGIDLGVPEPATVPFIKKSDFGACG